MTNRTDLTTPNRFLGKCLVATPKLNKTMWEETVILLSQHSDKIGTQGHVINRTSTTSVSKLFNDLGFHGHINIPGHIHLGGPVKERNISMIHSGEWYSASTMPVTPYISFSYDDFMIEKMCMGDIPDHFVMLAGAAQWAPAQLEQEIDNGSWLVIDSDVNLIFSNKEDIWTECVKHYSQSMFNDYI